VGPSWEWSRLGLFVFLLCPAAGFYGRLTFSFDRALFILDLINWLDVLASVFGLGKRECGAMPCSAFVVLKQPGGRRCNLETTVI